MRIFFVIAIILGSWIMSGCTITAGGKPMLGVETEKDKEGKMVPMFGTVITQHVHNPQIFQAAPSPPGTPPTPPAINPTGVVVTPLTGTAPKPGLIPAQYKVITKTADPTLRTFVNQTPNAIRVLIQGEPEIELLPYQSSIDYVFAPGDHIIKLTMQKTTAAGVMNTVRLMTIQVRPEGRWEIIYLQ